jgi:two-component system sensor histidine kinase KdpD
MTQATGIRPPAEEEWGTGPLKDRVLVCLSPEADCDRLIQEGRQLATTLQVEWFALYVETPARFRLPAPEGERLAQALRRAEEQGAQIHHLSGSQVLTEVLQFIQERRITQVVLGCRPRPRLFCHSLARKLPGRCNTVLHIIPGRNKPIAKETSSRKPDRSWWRLIKDYVIAAAGVGLCSVLALALFPYLTLTNLVMVYLLTVVLIASRLGRGPSIFASLFSIASFSFFFVPEYYSFRVATPEYAVTLGVMIIVSLLISGLTMQVRHQTRLARLREGQAAALFEMNRRLTGALNLEDLLAQAVNHISQTFQGRVSFLFPDPEGNLAVRAGAPLNPQDEKEWNVARWVYRHGHLAGQGTETLPQVEALYVPLRSSQQVIGVLRLETVNSEVPLTAERQRLLEALGSQVVLAIERENLRMQADKVRMEVEAERLRNILLSSVSHDLRTPLTVIAGAASTLLEGEAGLDASTKRELAQSIFEESQRLDRLVHNLLEMSRLQSGEVPLQLDWQVLEEVLGCALVQLDAQLKDHPVQVHLPPDLPLIQMDALLMERVFVNLLENIVKYTPPRSPVEISAKLQGNSLLLEFSDRGPGLPPGEEEKIFEKFYQPGPGGAARHGGLGLAICRSIVTAHGGKIWAANRAGGGATFSLTLPLAESPPLAQSLVEGQEACLHEAARSAD